MARQGHGILQVHAVSGCSSFCQLHARLYSCHRLCTAIAAQPFCYSAWPALAVVAAAASASLACRLLLSCCLLRRCLTPLRLARPGRHRQQLRCSAGLFLGSCCSSSLGSCCHPSIHLTLRAHKLGDHADGAQGAFTPLLCCYCWLPHGQEAVHPGLHHVTGVGHGLRHLGRQTRQLIDAVQVPLALRQLIPVHNEERNNNSCSDEAGRRCEEAAGGECPAHEGDEEHAPPNARQLHRRPKARHVGRQAKEAEGPNSPATQQGKVEQQQGDAASQPLQLAAVPQARQALRAAEQAEETC